jgi:hypothetical protein
MASAKLANSTGKPEPKCDLNAEADSRGADEDVADQNNRGERRAPRPQT